MKFLFTTKTPKGVVSLVFTESTNVRFIEHTNETTTIEIGIGKRNKVTRRKFILLVRKIILLLKNHKQKKVVLCFDDLLFPKLKNIENTEIASLIAQNLEMANFEFTTFRTKPKEGWQQVETVYFAGKINNAIRQGIQKGQLVGEYVNATRELANTPGGDMTPAVLAQAAKKAATGTKVEVSVFGKKELEKHKFGAILGVAKGSVAEPRFIIMEYWGARKGSNSKTSRNADKNNPVVLRDADKNNPVVLRDADKNNPVVLVGKGVTFDTGGINLKPGDSSLGMHLDMSGAAAVLHAIVLAAKLKVKKNIIALIPAVENMPSGSSYRPGDVLVSKSGKTIEILNTDAEGRVILADAITYARKYNPRLVVDVATLTGAALVAVGQRSNIFMTKDLTLQNMFIELGEESGDYMWPLPLWEEYEEEVKGSRGDVTNTHNKGNRYGGAINGGIFLHEFARGLTWVHIDMAPRMESIPSDNLALGATGEPVRFLLKLLEKY